MEKKTAVIQARISEELRARLNAINKRHLTSDSLLVINALEAICSYAEEHDKIAFPVKIVADEPKTVESKRRAS